MFFYYICCFQSVTLILSSNHSAHRIGLFTEKLSRQVIPATQELVRHFEWKNIVLLVQNTTKYTYAAGSIKNGLQQDVSSVRYIVPAPVEYDYPDDFASIVNVVSSATNQSRIIFLLMDFSMTMEFLIAGYDLKLASGEYVFIAFETDIAYVASRQRRPFKWVAAHYSTNWNEYTYRSYKLCQMWKVTLLIMLKVPNEIITIINKMSAEFYQRGGDVKLRGVNAWEEFNKIIFGVIGGHRMFVNEKGEITYPLHLYRYGNDETDATRCVECVLSKSERNSSCERLNQYPSIYSVGKFEVSRQCVPCTERWELTFNGTEKSQMHWPGNRSVYDIRDEPICGYHGEKCLATQGNVIFVGAIVATGIPVLLIIGVIAIYILFKRKQHRIQVLMIPSERDVRQTLCI